MRLQAEDRFNTPKQFVRHPSSFYNRLLSKLTVFLLLAFAMLIVSDRLGFRFNTTRSVDPGFYWVVDKPPEKGDLVSFCPAPNALSQLAYQRGYFDFGNCSGHYKRMLKQIVGSTGDRVEISNLGVAINGKLLPYSKPQSRDGLGRPLTPFNPRTIELGQDEYWVMTTRSLLSFDSRYFGPIHLAQVSDVVKPIWIWK